MMIYNQESNLYLKGATSLRFALKVVLSRRACDVKLSIKMKKRQEWKFFLDERKVNFDKEWCTLVCIEVELDAMRGQELVGAWWIIFPDISIDSRKSQKRENNLYIFVEEQKECLPTGNTRNGIWEDIDLGCLEKFVWLTSSGTSSKEDPREQGIKNRLNGGVLLVCLDELLLRFMGLILYKAHVYYNNLTLTEFANESTLSHNSDKSPSAQESINTHAEQKDLRDNYTH